MGTFQSALKKWFYTNNSSAATSTSRLPLLDANGNPIGSDTPKNIFKVQPIFTTNVGVATSESNYIYFRQPTEASSYVSSAIGVWVCECGRMLIIAKDEQTNLQWCQTQASGGTTKLLRSEEAFADFNGRTKTEQIINQLGTTAQAATYCQGYSPSNVDSSNTFCGVGRWWLPSTAQLWLMYSHLIEINTLMSMINGTLLGSYSYHSSSEASDPSAWYLDLTSGLFSFDNKTKARAVRPVSCLY